MSSKQVTARARVTVTIEIDAGSSWGHDCKMDQIYDQASRESVNHLERVLREANVRAVILGKPKVEAVITKDVT